MITVVQSPSEAGEIQYIFTELTETQMIYECLVRQYEPESTNFRRIDTLKNFSKIDQNQKCC